MRCKRCSGLVVSEASTVGELDEVASEVRGWRCLNCGARVDIRMLRLKAAHREAMGAGVGASTAGPSDGGPGDRQVLVPATRNEHGVDGQPLS